MLLKDKAQSLNSFLRKTPLSILYINLKLHHSFLKPYVDELNLLMDDTYLDYFRSEYCKSQKLAQPLHLWRVEDLTIICTEQHNNESLT